MKRLICLIALALLPILTQAAELTIPQMQTLKAVAQADQAANGYLVNGNDNELAQWFNADQNPDYIVIKTEITRHEVLTGTSIENTSFAWAAGAYITRSQGERDAFREMFNATGSVDPRLPRITAAFADIFSGTGGAGNRAHIAAISKRKATRAEAALASGVGSLASPSTLGWEGEINQYDVSAIRSQ